MKWIFEGRVYSSLEELKGKTMSEGNQPEPMFTLEEMKDFAEWAANAPKTNNIYVPEKRNKENVERHYFLYLFLI